MNERELAKQLEMEGFGHRYVWQDSPDVHYPEHRHAMETAHVILQGMMMLTMDRRTKSYHAGERCDVPADAVHSAKMGPQGCRYLIGER